MMILGNLILKQGDFFTSTLPALGHGVNIYGLMGAGVAALVRSRYPEVFEEYKRVCQNRELVAGEMLPIQDTSGLWILNLASQDKPGPHARLEWVENSLKKAFIFSETHNLEGFAIPRIGSNIGGLKWDDVFEVVQKVAKEHPSVVLEVWTL